MLLMLVRRSESVCRIHVCGSDGAAYDTHCIAAQNFWLVARKRATDCSALCLSISVHHDHTFHNFMAEQHDIPSLSPSLPPSLTASPPRLSKTIVSDLISPLARSVQEQDIQGVAILNFLEYSCMQMYDEVLQKRCSVFTAWTKSPM